MKHTSKMLAIALLSIGSTAMAQKTNETSAAVEYKKVEDCLGKMDFECAKKSLIKAKEYIDLAAEHADTKESPKTLFYKGEIYATFMIVAMQSQDMEFGKKAGEDPLETAVAAYKKSFDSSSKFDEDITNSINTIKGMLEGFTQIMFTNKLYKEAVQVYDAQIKLSSAINLVDTFSYNNAGVCSERAELWDQAAEYYKKCADMGYQTPEIYKNVALCYIRGGKRDEATAYLKMVIDKNPSDPQLQYMLGSLYMETKENDKALAALRKALELNPKYEDAQYQLGAFLVQVGNEYRSQANEMQLNDPNYEPYLAKSVEYFKEALVPLENYIAAQPKDKDVLKILTQIHGSLGNTDKSAAYKARLEALK